MSMRLCVIRYEDPGLAMAGPGFFRNLGAVLSVGVIDLFSTVSYWLVSPIRTMIICGCGVGSLLLKDCLCATAQTEPLQ